MNDDLFVGPPTPFTKRIVWRIQNELGNGPYQKNESTIRLLSSHDFDISEHPIPSCDPWIKRWIICETEVCAFLSLEQLNAWFTEGQINGLAKLGFEVVTIMAEVTGFGKFQCVCIPEKIS